MKIFDTRLILKNSIKTIQILMNKAFNATHLEIIDESAMHAHHASMQNNIEAVTHIHIRIQTPELSGLPRIAQHQGVYSALQPAIDNGLHAVRIEII